MADSHINRNKTDKDLENELKNLLKKKREVDENLKVIMKEEKINLER